MNGPFKETLRNKRLQYFTLRFLTGFRLCTNNNMLYNMDRRHYYAMYLTHISFYPSTASYSVADRRAAEENRRVDISKAKQIAFKGTHKRTIRFGPFISGSTALFTWSDHRPYIYRLCGDTYKSLS